MSAPTRETAAPLTPRLPANPARSHAAPFSTPAGQLERICSKPALLEALGRIEPHKETR